MPPPTVSGMTSAPVLASRATTTSSGSARGGGFGAPAVSARLSTSGWLGAMAVFLACLMSATLACAYGSTRDGQVAADGTGELDSLYVLWWLVGLGLAVAMMWRRRWPLHIGVVAGVVPILLPLDPLPALICLGTGVVHLRGRHVHALGALVTVATLVSLERDMSGATAEESFWRTVIDPVDGPPRVLPWWVPVVVAVALVAATSGIALLRRSWSALNLSRVRGEVDRRALASLNAEVARQGERERLAREVHDALGHRLSLLSLHAGALEVATEGSDPRIRQSAQVVRDGAQQAMQDLRGLLEMLRRPDTPDVSAPEPTLSDVPALVDESVAAGMGVVSTVNLDSTASLDPTVNRSGYRITQELLTNARRHAPGIPVRVLVHAGPSSGVVIEVANYLSEVGDGAGPPPGAVVPGNGLTGISERAAQHGGEAYSWIDELGVFRVAVRLPWRSTDGAGVASPAARPEPRVPEVSRSGA